MSARTTELIAKALGESGTENQVRKALGKKFSTGKDILKECEEYEHLIEREGEEAFMARVRAVVSARGGHGGDEEVSGGEAENNSTSGSDTTP